MSMAGERVWMVDDRVMPPRVVSAVVRSVEVGAMYTFDAVETGGILWAHASSTWNGEVGAVDRAKAIHRLQLMDMREGKTNGK